MIRTQTQIERSFVVLDYAHVAERLASFGFRLAQHEEVAPALETAESLLQSKLTPRHIVERIHRHTMATVWVLGSPRITGFLLTIPLSAQGERAMRDGSFRPSNPSLAHACAPGDPCFGYYCWVYGGETRDDRRSVMTACAILRVELVPSLPIFARGATEDGIRSMASLGLTPIQNAIPDLYVQEPITREADAA